MLDSIIIYLVYSLANAPTANQHQYPHEVVPLSKVKPPVDEYDTAVSSVSPQGRASGGPRSSGPGGTAGDERLRNKDGDRREGGAESTPSKDKVSKAAHDATCCRAAAEVASTGPTLTKSFCFSRLTGLLCLFMTARFRIISSCCTRLCPAPYEAVGIRVCSKPEGGFHAGYAQA